METADLVEQVVREHVEMRSRLAEWEAGLAQLAAGGLLEFQDSLQRLWRLVPFFEEEVGRHFREEEAELFTAVQAHHPTSGPALARFAAEHARFARHWQEYRWELLCCDTVAETPGLCALGRWLIRLLRQHMQEEEEELLPLTAKGRERPRTPSVH